MKGGEGKARRGTAGEEVVRGERGEGLGGTFWMLPPPMAHAKHYTIVLCRILD